MIQTKNPTEELLIFLYLNQDKEVWGSFITRRLPRSRMALWNALTKMENEGLIKKKKRLTKHGKDSGTTKYVVLTKKGLEVSKRLYEICELMK